MVAGRGTSRSRDPDVGLFAEMIVAATGYELGPHPEDADGGQRLVMTSKLSPGASGAIHRFAGWVARGSVGHPMLDGINYWDELKEAPTQMETCFAIFANVLELDDAGEPVNEKYAEKRAATWLHQYFTGALPTGEPDLEAWECELY